MTVLSADFDVVTQVHEIVALNSRLAHQLMRSFPYVESREISYPAGHFPGRVFFEKEGGHNVRAWCPDAYEGKLVNFLMFGDPGAKDWLTIEVQLNFPGDKYNRRLAGAFVRDKTGTVFIAHRGNLTKGRAGLPKAKVFREFAARVIEAADLNKSSRLILIGALDDPQLTRQLWDFAFDAREVAARIGLEDEGVVDISESGCTGGYNEKKLRKSALILRSYFNEYTGTSVTKGRAEGARVVLHGDVVGALEAHLHDRGLSQKSQAVDLAIVGEKEVSLFEVKTSASTTDLYTGVGQLLIHGACLQDLLGLPVQRFLVLPEEPPEPYAQQLRTKLVLNIVTYSVTKDGYFFKGV